MRPLVLLALLAIGSAPLPAQEHATLTLERAVRLATEAAPAAQAASGTRALIVGRARADAQWVNPQLEVRRENLNTDLPYDDFVTLTLPISVTGRRFALRDALGAARLRAAADSLAVLRGAEYGAATAWWEAWVAERAERLSAEQAARFDELARFDSLRAAEGAIAEAAALRTRLEASRAAYAQAQAVAAAARARGGLAARLGLADATGLRLAESDLDSSDRLLDDSTVVRIALESRPDVRAAQAYAREADRRWAAERRNVLQDVEINTGYKGSGDIPGAVLGLYITPPLFNANGGAREEREGAWLLADADRRATELRAANDVRAALAALRAMDAATADIDAGFLARADTIATAAEAAYREGAATLTETLEALRALGELRGAALRAIADRALTRLDLRRAMGVPALEPK